MKKVALFVGDVSGEFLVSALSVITKKAENTLPILKLFFSF